MKLRILIFLMLLVCCKNAIAEGTDIPLEDAMNNNGIARLSDSEFWFFVFGCGVIGILVKIVDYSIKLNQIGTVRKLENFTEKGALIEWSLWFISASIVGFLGNQVGLFQASIQAAVMIGLGWPTVFSQIKQRYSPQSDSKETVDQQRNEVYEDLNLGRECITSNECYDIDEEKGK
ncbi:hypothetical protein [Nitrosomonas ureae]|uniref:Holin n=1 Tax=Nitrosomonas ureae TaxID=44577 RepID=A0A1H2GCR1_9PROT|nr:hypothetical protein [Nitrosomonas ureae]ALQ51723.1 hypothetical protein ATY38_11110 [Nitrosomonas ureae]SDU17417.1 hypothetical protein SAMN05216406_13034 [Nitrosomonas ureae]